MFLSKHISTNIKLIKINVARRSIGSQPLMMKKVKEDSYSSNNERKRNRAETKWDSSSYSNSHNHNRCFGNLHHARHFHASSTTFKGNKDNDDDSNLIFDRKMKQLQRDSAARMYVHPEQNKKHDDTQDVVDYDYFQKEIALRLVDRLDDIKREEGFPLALDIGAGAGHLHRAICMDDAFTGEGGIGGIRKIVQMDSAKLMLHRDDHIPVPYEKERCDTYKLVADEEDGLPFPDGTFDLVLSSAALHFVNDLPSLFKEVKRVLKPDGCFMFAMVGGATLPELRSSLVLAELERDGGVSPHVGPFVDFADVGQLIQSAGFTLPTVDIDTIHFAFPNAIVLMEHLQRMGEGNVCFSRKDRISLDTFIASAAIYQEMFPLGEEFQSESDDNDNDEQGIIASVQIIYAIGWSPHESQQKPLERGTGTHKVGEIVESYKHESKPR